MPTINCPDCKKSISDSATVCPKCGRAITQGDVARGKKINKGSQIAASVIVGIVLLTFAFCCFKGKSIPDDVQLNAKVYSNGSLIVIENLDKHDWTDVKIRVNTRYMMKSEIMKAGKIYKIGVRQFTDNNNNVFNSYLMKLKSVSIACKLTDARAFYYSEFD